MPDPDPACDPVFLIGILILLDLILKMFIKKLTSSVVDPNPYRIRFQELS